MMVPFIPKENVDIPDFYTITVTYLNGKKVSYDVVSHSYMEKLNSFEFVGSDDKFRIITNYCEMEFDLNYTRFIEAAKSAKTE